nr:NAD(P)-dependent oxidoreductase [Nitrosopumilaceae archaeon]NIU88232.1 NAD-dependent epimerase/dehydratase family protein [Nitrosopumilaceae archaeon]NIX60903.1 NAD-dependent epimerase/dehydratase family protein [Nitrosopumilaceae archaeon]
MTNSLFVTGSSGFIGRNFLNQLEHNKYDKIVCLTRNPSLLTQYISEIQNLEIVKSDLLDWKKYEDKLKKCNMVIHFAALTGKHKPEAYFRVNTKGTQLLIDNCKQSGIRNFL